MESCSHLKCSYLTAGLQDTFVIQIPDENNQLWSSSQRTGNTELTEKEDILFMCAYVFIYNPN